MRVNSPRRQKHKKILKLAKGYRLARSKRYKVAHESVLHAGQYAYNGRKLRKRDKRQEWILQINAGLTAISMDTGNPKMSYSTFINKLKTNNISLDRKVLAQLANDDANNFRHLVDTLS